jgi:hypothetical protein
MEIAGLKRLVAQAQARFDKIQSREFDATRGQYRKSMTEMWTEASQIGQRDWWEVIRVLGQGGDYYGMAW